MVAGCSGDRQSVGRSGKGKSSTTAARTSARATPPRRPAARLTPRPPASQIVTRPLLDEKWTLTAPPARRIARLYNLLKARHWRLGGYRHSRLPDDRNGQTNRR